MRSGSIEISGINRDETAGGGVGFRRIECDVFGKPLEIRPRPSFYFDGQGNGQRQGFNVPDGLANRSRVQKATTGMPPP